MMIDDYLMHYGKKGMRWNVRKTEQAKKKSPFRRLVEKGAAVANNLINNYGSVKINTITETKKTKKSKKTSSREPSARFIVN